MRRFVLPVIVMLATLACAAGPGQMAAAYPRAAVDSSTAPHVRTIVENQNFYDFDVFVLSAGGGQIQKLGTVAGLKTATFVITGAYVAGGQTVRFYARSRLSGQEYNSPQITIYEGYGLRWVLDNRGYEWLSSYRSAAH